MAKHRIVFLVFQGVKHLDVAGPAEVFAEATRLGAEYDLTYVSPNGDEVGTSVGLHLQAGSAALNVATAGTVVIPGGDSLPRGALSAELRSATAHLVSVADRVASVCTGAFLLASVGALEGRRATTHWAHAALLARVSPGVEVISDALFLQDGKFHTSAGVSSGIDLALSIVEADHGPELARQVAQQLVVYMRRPDGQSQFSTLLELSRGTGESVKRIVQSVSAHPQGNYGTHELAKMAGVSSRHLTRLFQAELGMTPAKCVERIRLETAKALLLQGEAVAAAAERSGFQTPETLRRVFVHRLGMPPSAFRERFASTGSTSKWSPVD
ncbi:GlxA family transcriptional regulator [Nesterenkonia flava]|uniref:DJ-1/PfpI family protein n=1 Tax=Nesterenkonia flava TaxID=469799 RepID=A0ABU1FPF8_9MICC|nr:DJ-1/PfpI family protein [Nesterenkonia flava]MDR5710532.1 DJ-1/PfpI family protein [Nesterenkonia flava]